MYRNRSPHFGVRILRLGLIFSSALCLSVGPPREALAANGRVDDEAQRRARQLAETGVHFDLEGATSYASYAWRSALREDPNCELARWRLGFVRSDRGWINAAELDNDGGKSATLKRYQQRRAASMDGAQRELALARWCRGKSMPDRAEIHYRRVLGNAQSPQELRTIAIRELGLRPYGGELLSEDQVFRLQQLHRRAQLDLQFWTGKLRQPIRQIERGRRKVRLEAISKLRTIEDPAAIPAIELLLSGRSDKLASEAVGIISAIDHPDASASLARHSVASQWPSVREEATFQLRKRSLHDFIPTLLTGLRTPIRSVFQITPGAEGRILHEHVFFQEGQDENRQLTVQNVAVAAPQNDQDAGQGAIQELTRVKARAQAVEANVAQQNAMAEQQNERIYEVLQTTTGEELLSEPSVWWDWWKNYNEFELPSTKPTRTFSQNFTYAYLPQARTCECFPAGTLVWTERGKVAIETIRVGDRVLSQQPETGELDFKVVRTVTRREDAPMQTLVISNTRLTLTTGHPLWVNGAGWRMAKKLKLSDSLHTIRGAMEVEQMELAGKGRAFNLVIDEFGSYFVTELGVLAHDNTYRQATRAISPGLLAQRD